MRRSAVLSCGAVLFACALEPEVNRAGSNWALEEGAVRDFLTEAGCGARKPRSREELQRVVEATSKDIFSSQRFRRDVVRILTDDGFHPERQTAIEIGIGSSGTTVVLAALFCKLIVLELNSTVLSWSVTRGLPHVIHRQADSTRDPWHRDLAQEGPPVRFIFVDGSHQAEHVWPDVARSLALLAETTGQGHFANSMSLSAHDREDQVEPAIVFHDWNLASVRGVVSQYEATGALHSCQGIGEPLPGFKDGFDGSPQLTRCRRGDCADYKGELFPEGRLCRVSPAKAARVANAASPDYFSVLPFPGRLWQLYDHSSNTPYPRGMLRFFSAGRGARHGTMLLMDMLGGLKQWFARWWQISNQDGRRPKGYAVLGVLVETARGLQKGKIVLAAGRSSLAGMFESRLLRGRPWAANETEPRSKPRHVVLGPCLGAPPPASGDPCLPPANPGSEVAVQQNPFPIPSFYAVSASEISSAVEAANVDWIEAGRDGWVPAG